MSYISERLPIIFNTFFGCLSISLLVCVDKVFDVVLLVILDKNYYSNVTCFLFTFEKDVCVAVFVACFVLSVTTLFVLPVLIQLFDKNLLPIC